MEEKCPEFMANLSTNAFINRFHDEWGSAVSIDNYRFEAFIII